MLNTFFAKKIRMTGKFTPEGERKGVSLLYVPPMQVTGKRVKEKNGYEAIEVKISAGIGKKDVIKEIRDVEGFEPGQEIKLEEVVQAGDKLNIKGQSKGKGFAGAVKRWGFKGGPRTHGQSDRERAPGSSGPTTTPGRVLKGKRRAGHMGAKTVMVKGVKVLEVDAEKRIVTVIGAVPGANNYKLLTIKKQA